MNEKETMFNETHEELKVWMKKVNAMMFASAEGKSAQLLKLLVLDKAVSGSINQFKKCSPEQYEKSVEFIEEYMNEFYNEMMIKDTKK